MADSMKELGCMRLGEDLSEAELQDMINEESNSRFELTVMMVTLLPTIFYVAVQLFRWTTTGLYICMASTLISMVSVVVTAQRRKQRRMARTERLAGDAAEAGGHPGRRAAAPAKRPGRAPDTRCCQDIG